MVNVPHASLSRVHDRTRLRSTGVEGFRGITTIRTLCNGKMEQLDKIRGFSHVCSGFQPQFANVVQITSRIPARVCSRLTNKPLKASRSGRHFLQPATAHQFLPSTSLWHCFMSCSCRFLTGFGRIGSVGLAITISFFEQTRCSLRLPEFSLL